MNDNISLYKGIVPQPTGEASWQAALSSIQDGTFKAEIVKIRLIDDVELYRKAKKRLPAVTFAATFNGTRNNSSVLSATGFIIADFDHLDDVEGVFDLLKQDEKIWFIFRSPSGNGLKAGLCAEGISNDADIKRFNAAMESYFADVYELKTDPACKDISRLTFISHDTEAFINPTPYFFDIAEKGKSEEQKPPAVENTFEKEKYALKVLAGCCEKIRSSAPGEQHETRLRMGRLVGGFIHYLNENTALDELRNAVETSGARDMDAAMRTVHAGLEDGKKSPITIDDLPRHDAHQAPPAPRQRIDLEAWRSTIAFSGEPPKREYLVEGVFPRGQVSLVGAAGGIGKSYALLDLFRDVSLAVDASLFFKAHFGGVLKLSGPAVYLSGEDDSTEVHGRIDALGGPAEHLYAVPFPSAGGADPFFNGQPDARGLSLSGLVGTV